MGIILVILFVIICAAMGDSKGYSAVLCGVAGLFGGLIAIIVIALLPNRKEEQEAAAQKESAREREISELKQRIAELESTQKDHDSFIS